MPQILKITPGVAEVDPKRKLRVRIVEGDITLASFGASDINRDDWENNAAFYAEAHTVAIETGVMPRELLAQRDELLAALKAAEARDEDLHVFSDLECFADDPETHKDYIDECRRREKQRRAIRRAEGQA